MTQLSEPSDFSAQLTAAEAFKAMHHFLKAYSKRYPQSSEDIDQLVGDIDCSFTPDGGPVDPAQWSDWLHAIEKVKR
jgi:hypothetical protein